MITEEVSMFIYLTFVFYKERWYYKKETLNDIGHFCYAIHLAFTF